MVTRIYLDPSALVLPSAGPTAADEHVAPGAKDAVAHLVEAGFEVILLGEATAERRRELPREVSHADALPEHLDAEEIAAELKDGVLTVRLPRAAGARARKIEVSIH